MRSIIVRLDEQLFQDFDRLCKERGYAKQGLIRRLIRELVYSTRVKSLPIEEALPDEAESLRKLQEEVIEGEALDWERVKGAL